MSVAEVTPMISLTDCVNLSEPLRIDVIDCGVPVLSMHSPYEVTSKFDIYESYRTYEAFMK